MTLLPILIIHNIHDKANNTPRERTFPEFSCIAHIATLCGVNHRFSEWLGCRQEVSGQQISAFALQIGDLPSHPSSTAAAAAAAAAQLHACPRVPTVAKEMLRDLKRVSVLSVFRCSHVCIL